MRDSIHKEHDGWYWEDETNCYFNTFPCKTRREAEQQQMLYIVGFLDYKPFKYWWLRFAYTVENLLCKRN